jgi:hypothetical protein
MRGVPALRQYRRTTFRVLAILIRRPGELVTREEFRSQIWPADTFVDFDNSLNTSINKLRETLSDSAESPRFIETLPRRGYRFIAPVSSSDRKVPTQAWKIIVAVVAVAALVAGGLFWRSRQARRLTEKDTIVLGDFANSTGGPSLRWNAAGRPCGRVTAVTLLESSFRPGNARVPADDGETCQCATHPPRLPVNYASGQAA